MTSTPAHISSIFSSSQNPLIILSYHQVRELGLDPDPVFLVEVEELTDALLSSSLLLTDSAQPSSSVHPTASIGSRSCSSCCHSTLVLALRSTRLLIVSRLFTLSLVQASNHTSFAVNNISHLWSD